MEMRLKCEAPGEIVYTVMVTATAKEWETFRDTLDETAMRSLKSLEAVHRFRSQINDLLAQARKIYWPTDSAGVAP